MNGHRPTVRTAAATEGAAMTSPTWESVARMLSEANTADAPRRDTSAGWKASAKSRAEAAAERLAVEKFAPVVDLLSEATVAKLTELLIARCVGKLSDAMLVDLTEQLVDECRARRLAVPVEEDEQGG